MKILTQIIHWSAYSYLVYVFGYASLFKVFQKKSMMDNMKNFGFEKIWTLFIGYGELIGVLGLLIGIYIHQAKNISILWLFPFAIGALMVHFAHHDYKYFYTALFCCIACVVVLLTDSFFKLSV